MMAEHSETYSARADVRLSVTPLREQIAAPARTILLVLLAAAGVVFVIACSNVANLILARSVRREGELAVRAALGASRGALRRTLLAESLVLCGAGAVLGVVLASPLVAVVARFAARFSVRALEVTVDPSLLWVGVGPGDRRGGAAGVRPAAAVGARAGRPRAGGRQRPDHARHQPPPARVCDDADSVFVRAARRRRARSSPRSSRCRRRTTGYDMRQVLAVDLPTRYLGIRDAKEMDFYKEMTRAHRPVAGRQGVAIGSFVPWRDAGTFPVSSSPSRATRPRTAKRTRTRRLRIVAPRFFAVLGVPMLAGRDFTDEDRRGSEPW